MNTTGSLRRGLAVSLASVVTLGLAACTAGGDDGDSLSTDDGGEAAAALAAAVEQTRASSGRFTTTFAETSTEESDETFTIEGEFADGAIRTTTSAGDEMLFGSGPRLNVGERSYSSVAGLREALEDPVWGETGLDDGSESRDLTPLDGYEWIDTTDLDYDAQLMFEEGVGPELDPTVAMLLTDFFNEDPFRILTVVTDVEDVGTESADGAELRRYSATLPLDAIYELLFDDPEMDDLGYEPSARDAAIDSYVESRTSVHAELFVDAEGQLVRSAVSASTDVEEQFADCEPLGYQSGTLTVATEFRDLGGDVDVAAPDPATTMTIEQLTEAFPSTWSDEYAGDEGSGDEGADDELAELAELETVDGLRDRWDVIDDLSKFGYVIGLGVDEWTLSEEEWGTTPDPVYELSDEELAARYAELRAALDALPRTPTALGELARPELLWNVRWGLDAFGADPAAADAMSDAELGALIDGYAESQGGPVGDGVVGDLPEGTELSEPPEFVPGDGEGFTGPPGMDEDDEYYAGCPE